MPPIFFVFNKTIACEHLPEDDQTSISNYNEQLESDWLSFWTASGEDIVHTTWTRKYSEFLLKEEGEEDLESSGKLIVEESREEESNAKEEVVLLTENQNQEEVQDISEELISEEANYSSLWQDLWNAHYTEIYQNTYQLFSTVHSDHFNFYRLKDQEDTNDGDFYSLYEEEDEELDFDDQTEELEALGLPTHFGGPNNKYHKNRSNDFNSDSYSDQQTETEEDFDMAPSTQKHPISDKQQTTKKKKKNRKLKRMPKIILEDKSLRGYWCKRFSLFSRFEEGIQLDRESWFSVTPEKVAIHMAERLRCDTLIDAFCGSGGNSIQFARTCERVIAIDIDPEKIKNARHNAEIYGVAHKIDFIIGDFLQLCENLKGDVVFLSPPWGGPQYISQKEYNIEESLIPMGACDLAAKARLISENIAFFLPRNSNPQQIAKVAGIGNRVEVEHNYLNTKLIGLTAIYGNWLIDKQNLNCL